jgi:oxysterol-binding protein-related protein 1/2
MNYYNFNEFTFCLNEFQPELNKKSFIITDTNRQVSLGPLPCTDSRLRPDLRLYENGQIELASFEKNRLEEKQRETRHKMESGEIESFKPNWFDRKYHSVVNGEETWLFNQKYWNREFSKCPNIY